MPSVGYTPDLAVWTRNPDHSPMHNVSGIVVAAPIFHAFMSGALAAVPDHWYSAPADLATSRVGRIPAFLLPGTEAVAAASQPPPPPAPVESSGGGGGITGTTKTNAP